MSAKPPVERVAAVMLATYMLPYMRYSQNDEVLTPEEAAASALRRAEAFVERVKMAYPDVATFVDELARG